MMLDSGSAVSLVREDTLPEVQGIERLPPTQMRLVTASGEPMAVIGHIRTSVQLGLEADHMTHNFLVVGNLVAPVILGVDFLQKHKVILDFASNPVAVQTKEKTKALASNGTLGEHFEAQVQAILQSERSSKVKRYTVATVGNEKGNVDVYQTKFKIDSQAQPYSPHSIFRVGIGKCQLMMMMLRRLPSVQAQGWGYSNLSECHSAWQVPPVLSKG